MQSPSMSIHPDPRILALEGTLRMRPAGRLQGEGVGSCYRRHCEDSSDLLHALYPLYSWPSVSCCPRCLPWRARQGEGWLAR